MTTSKRAIALGAGLVAVLVVAFLAVWFLGEEPIVSDDELAVYFLDVGQGDAVLIRAIGGQDVLYDGGTRGSGTLEQLQRLGVDELQLVIASHPHADHIGGLIEVIEHYQPTYVLDNGQTHTTQTYEDLLDAIEAAGSQILEPTRRNIRLGEATQLQILPPPGDDRWDLNDNSVVAILMHGDFRLSLTGDAEERQWSFLLEEWEAQLRNVHVHKASHHGSRNGDTPAGIRLLRPEVVIVSAGADNRYGHPHEEALSLYADVGAAVYRTDVEGTVRVVATRQGRYEVASLKETEPRAPPVSHTAPPFEEERASNLDCIDINSAVEEELQQIIHVGPARAQEIVRLRPYHAVDDLTRVRGIGEAVLSEIIAEEKACLP